MIQMLCGLRRAAPLSLLLATATFAAVPASSPASMQPSAPQPLPIAATIPDAADRPWPGVLAIAVDATDTARGIFRVRETIPVANPGRLTLLYPKWLPGEHAPSGEVDKLAGLRISAGGRALPWIRDAVDTHAFHVDVPEGAREILAEFQYVSATTPAQGPIVMTADMMNMEWVALALYPAGHFVRQIRIQPTVTYPAGWTAATALRGTATGATIHYEPVAFDTLMDSPVFAGRNARKVELRPGVSLSIFADRPEQLRATDAQIEHHRALVDQADRLFGARHYDHYDFLFALSDRLTPIGLEHHRSSQNGVAGGYFLDWANAARDRSLLPHEYVHSWNGKFRRPADLWTPDYRMPMRNSLLWVYEGQTEFWGSVLAARSGLVSREEALGELASIAATYSEGRPGREWRNLQDTTNQALFGRGLPLAWTSWQRTVDYYNEGLLVWLDADTLIREKTGGQRSLDDFARGFFGVRDGDWGELTYRFEDVVAALNAVVPYDWAAFLRERLDRTGGPAPLDGLARGGYRLAFAETPNAYDAAVERARKITDLSYSIGLVLNTDNGISAVRWDGPAFKAGIAVGDTLIAVNGRAADAPILKDAIRAAKADGQPIRLLVRSADRYSEVPVAWTGGLRYPVLEPVAGRRPLLDALLSPRK